VLKRDVKHQLTNFNNKNVKSNLAAGLQHCSIINNADMARDRDNFPVFGHWPYILGQLSLASLLCDPV